MHKDGCLLPRPTLWSLTIWDDFLLAGWIGNIGGDIEILFF